MTISWRQSCEHPSPSTVFPSSHCSTGAAATLSPQVEVQRLDVAEKPVSVSLKFGLRVFEKPLDLDRVMREVERLC